MESSSERQKSQFASTWVFIAGCALGAATLIFFMILVIMAIQGYEVPKDSRFLVVVVMALGAALSSAFLGGHAAINGKIPFPAKSIYKGNTMKFSATGGIGVFIISMIVGYLFYATPKIAHGNDLIKESGTGFPPPETKIYDQKCILARSSAESQALRAIARAAEARINANKTDDKRVVTAEEIQTWINASIKGARIVEEKPGKDCDTYTVIMEAPFSEIDSGKGLPYRTH